MFSVWCKSQATLLKSVMLQQNRSDKEGIMTLNCYFAFAGFGVWTFVLWAFFGGVFWVGYFYFILFCFYCGPYKKSGNSSAFCPSLPSSWFAYKTCYFTVSKTYFQKIPAYYFSILSTEMHIWFVMLNLRMMSSNTRFLFQTASHTTWSITFALWSPDALAFMACILYIA